MGGIILLYSFSPSTPQPIPPSLLYLCIHLSQQAGVSCVFASSVFLTCELTYSFVLWGVLFTEQVG